MSINGDRESHVHQLQKKNISSFIPGGSPKTYVVSELLTGIEKVEGNIPPIIVYPGGIPVLDRDARNKIRSRVEALKEENLQNIQKGNPSKLKKWLII